MATILTTSNVHNIPAVCRIPEKGTATLVSPGMLLTSTHVVGTADACASLTAIFFEGTKKKPVEVKLLPQKYFFAAAYPEYMDYCLVACEEAGLLNVVPVTIPLTKDQWAPVTEGDIILVVQHPAESSDSGKADPEVGDIAPAAGSADPPLVMKRFVEVLRHRDDLFYLKTTRDVRTAGCPAFNDRGQLIGLQSQVRHPRTGIVNHVVSITAIVKHLFANKQLWSINRNQTFEEVWNTWYVKNDITRILSITANFKSRAITRETILKLCEHAAQREILNTLVREGGAQAILNALDIFIDDEEVVFACIKALWNISFSEELIRLCLGGGKSLGMILDAMEKFPKNEQIAEHATLFLHNICSGNDKLDFERDVEERALTLVHSTLRTFKGTVMLQKFGFAFFNSLIATNLRNAEILVGQGVIAHLVRLAQERKDNVLLMEVVMRFLGFIAQNPRAVNMYVTSRDVGMGGGSKGVSVITGLLVDIMLKHKDVDRILLDGSQALWGFGNDVACRAVILQHPRAFEALRISLPAVISHSKVL